MLTCLRFVLLCPAPLLWGLLLAGRFDLLGGLNKTDAGFSVLLGLLVLAPTLPLVGLVVEVLRLRYRRRRNRPTSRRHLMTAGFAWLLGMSGALLVLTGLRM